MERACFQETNRLVRIRMLGGVGGRPGNRAPIPISLLFVVFEVWLVVATTLNLGCVNEIAQRCIIG